MKKRMLLISRVIGIIAFYSFILTISIFFTMSILIKGEEIKAPDLIGKSLDEAYEIAAKNGFFIKKVKGNYSRNYKPLTVIEQVPEPGVHIKLKSNVKIFITSELVEVIVPELTGYSFEESARLIKESELKKRYVSYISSNYIPADFVISQSYEAGSRVPLNSSIDILVSKGNREHSYIMPDIIGKKAEKIVIFFEKIGLKIDKITEISYPGLDPGVIIWQHPSPGHKIGQINRISIQVSI
ncbi:MAG: PASTA domain-containing protein [Acidobacteriota bacterium]